MSLTKRDVYNIFAKISLEFKDFCNMPEEKLLQRVESWHESLKQYPKDIVVIAVNNVIKKSEFEPKISTVINEINSLIKSQGKSEFELWEELDRCLYSVYHYASYLRYPQYYNGANKKIEEIFEGLSKPIQHYLQNSSTLVHITNMTREELNYEKARFLKSIKGIEEKQYLREQAENFIALIEQKTVKQIGDKQ